MGKKVTLWLNEEAYSLIGEVEGKGTIINQLIIDYFSNDEDVIQEKLSMATRTRDMLKAQLTEIREAKMKKLNKQKKKQELTKAQLERKNKIEEMKRKWQNDEITDKEYWEFMDNVKNN